MLGRLIRKAALLPKEGWVLYCLVQYNCSLLTLLIQTWSQSICLQKPDVCKSLLCFPGPFSIISPPYSFLNSRFQNIKCLLAAQGSLMCAASFCGKLELLMQTCSNLFIYLEEWGENYTHTFFKKKKPKTLSTTNPREKNLNLKYIWLILLKSL